MKCKNMKIKNNYLTNGLKNEWVLVYIFLIQHFNMKILCRLSEIIVYKINTIYNKKSMFD